ncbi:MAG: hypothetical protein PHC62_11750, partial [Candidatus Izemoplasmatales bacterium]|nr:hypothetical protein [Candidatus Izemoplasmatales bacterium]
GGDKNVKYLHFPEEKNPFLGYRSLRYCLQDKKLFITQLRALLRTTIYGKLCILFPMIATLGELRLAKKILSEVEFDLVSKGVTVKPYQIGMMVEIPSVAVLVDKFAKEVDFFSIGTNDLIQYMFSADRMNPNVAYLYQPYHPALHRLIKNVIEAAHAEKKWVGLCGEIASDPYASLLLVGLGIDELSMTSSSILEIKKNLSKSNYNDLTILANSIIQDEETNSGVLEKLQNYFETSISDSL